MTPQRRAELTLEAQATLRANDRGGYTVPTERLYPFQWNWDAGISALGWMALDEARAWDEFRWLLRGQWNAGPQDGFIPHIVYHHPSDSYFPGADEWGAPKRNPPTSSISQPPLHATMLRWMQARARDQVLAQTRLREILPAIARHHAWWYRTRDPKRCGLVMVIHPWETGCDNSPAWDKPLERVPRATRPYQRLDLDHVGDSQRPAQAYYDRVVRLMDFNREVAFDPDVIASSCPFRVVDAALVFILHRATKDLLTLADELGIDLPDDTALRAALARTDAAAPVLWSDAIGQYCSVDLIADELIEQPVHGGLLSWYAGIDDGDQGLRQAVTLDTWLAQAPYGIPSTRIGAPAFEAQSSWRGPVWQHMNMLFEVGLRECGHTALADLVRSHSLALFEHSGFREYYDPLTGEGLGGDRFSWTAASWLHGFAAETTLP